MKTDITSNKKALVTGATSGIGRATAIALAKNGYDLLLVGRRQPRLEELKTQLEKLSSGQKQRFLVVSADLQNKNEIENIFVDHSEFLKDLDVLINNAGLAMGVDKMQDADVSDWETMIDTNVKALLYLTRKALPAMVSRQKGMIINLGSVAGRWTYPGGGVYCATKFAVRAISEGLRMDLLGTGIRVTNIEPGMVETEFSEVRLGSAEKAKAVYAGMKALSAEDIAQSILWCIEQPPHVNIQELVIFPTDQAAVGQVFRR